MAMAMEFRSFRDDAWYDVRVETQSNGDNGRRLRVRFSGFDDGHDEFIDGKDLRSPEDVAAVRSRFRAISAQLQDSECGQVHGGMVVCAAQSVCPDDRRFFDAVVDSVVRSEHKVENGEEQCACRFILSWKHGPNVGLLTDVALENICRFLKPPAADEQLDPKLMSFLNSARGSVQGTRVSGDLSSRDGSSGSKTCRIDNAGKLQQVTRFGRRSSSHLKGAEQAGDDIDIGGLPHMIIIENLEKRISPLTIMEFIHQQLSISCQAFVSPSKLLETYTRAAILLDSKRKLDKLSAFLENPDHIVVSSNGRPWLMTETTPVPDTLRGLIATFMLTSQKVSHRRTGTCNELKVVISGTKEYEMAKKLKDLAGKFVSHLCQLHQRLVIEEGRLLEIPKPV